KLSVQLFKIKAHSGIILNEQADQLDKDACKCKDYIKLNYTLPNLPNNLLIWNKDVVIDQDARKTIKTIQNFQQYHKFINHNIVKHIRHRLARKSFNLKWTYKWLNASPYGLPTSSQLSMYMSYKIKYHLNRLPTTDILHLQYPRLIQQHKCFFCSKAQDNNVHLWRCTKVIDHLYNASRSLARGIIVFLSSIYPKKSTSITTYVNHLELFNPAPFRSGHPLRENHPIFILFNQLLPNCLVNIFKKYRVNSKKSMPFLFTALADFYKHLHINIWKTRSVHFKNYKHTNN